MCAVVRASSRESKRPAELQEDGSGRVDMREWQIDHEGDAQGSDDPTNKISVTYV